MGFNLLVDQNSGLSQFDFRLLSDSLEQQYRPDQSQKYTRTFLYELNPIMVKEGQLY
jgi:hypothetical protein